MEWSVEVTGCGRGDPRRGLLMYVSQTTGTAGVEVTEEETLTVSIVSSPLPRGSARGGFA